MNCYESKKQEVTVLATGKTAPYDIIGVEMIEEHFHYGIALRCFAAIASALQRCNALCSALSR